MAVAVMFSLVIAASFPGPLVARAIVVEKIAWTRAGFGHVFGLARTQRPPTAAVVDADALALSVLDRLVAIPDAIEWERGFAYRDGAVELDGTEPEEDIGDEAAIRYAYDRWEEERLRPLLQSDPTLSAIVEPEVERLRPQFQVLTSQFIWHRATEVFLLLLTVAAGIYAVTRVFG